jgi:hypothetical protein
MSCEWEWIIPANTSLTASTGNYNQTLNSLIEETVSIVLKKNVSATVALFWNPYFYFGMFCNIQPSIPVLLITEK